MKTILVLAGGGEADDVVFGTALAAARALGAHLEFLHMRVSTTEAARFTPHVDFAMGQALHDVLGRLQAKAERRSAAAASHFQRFCQREKIEITETPIHSRGMSAAWREEPGDAVERITFRARRNDLVVAGRRSRPDGLPSDLLDVLLVGCGRPLLVVPPQIQPRVTGTVLICWKEHAAAARAVGAALPLLSKSERVVIVSVEESGEGSLDGIRELARHLAWHGITAEVDFMPAKEGSTAKQLESAAAEYDADLLVMGAYSHSRAREIIFGGCTQHFLDQSTYPVFMVH